MVPAAEHAVASYEEHIERVRWKGYARRRTGSSWTRAFG
jgi:hypothetical protein